MLTRLASWSFGFVSPLRCELVFFSNQLFTSRRWGTASPVLAKFSNLESLVPIRAFGNFNIQLRDPVRFFNSVFGTRSFYSVAELDEFVQGQIVETLPEALQGVRQLEDLSQSYDTISKKITAVLNQKLAEFGFMVSNLPMGLVKPSLKNLAGTLSPRWPPSKAKRCCRFLELRSNYGE